MTAEQIMEMYKTLREMTPEQAQEYARKNARKSTEAPAKVAASNEVYFPRYVEKECGTQEERKNLTDDVESFWARLKEYEAKSSRAYGLAVGRVQSGKTRNYIGLMFKAIDEGYNTIIVLTSKSNLLAQQTHDRVANWFQRDGLDVPTFNALTRVNNEGIEWVGGEFSPKRINVGIIIKNVAGHLANLKDWLTRIGSDELKSMKLLFVDDESDAATPNSNVTGDPEIESDADVDVFSARILDKANDEMQEMQQTERCEPVFRSIVVNRLRLNVEEYKFAAKWVKRLNEAEMPEADLDRVHEWLDRCATATRLFNEISSNAEIKRMLLLNSEYLVDGMRVSESETIERVFRRKATRNNFPNQSIFREYLNYVFGVKIERSKINNAISEIVSSINVGKKPLFDYGKMTYVGYTATPFANLLNEDPMKDPLCPDCIKPLSASTKYFGLERIFGGDPVYGDGRHRCRMNIVREIGKEEYSGWIVPIQNGGIRDQEGGIIGDENASGALVRRAEGKSVEWKSLEDAIKWAFCTAAARRVLRLEGKNNAEFADKKYRWTTMLFNISHLANQSEGAHAVQETIVKYYLAMMLSEARRARFLEECMDVWREQTAAFTSADFGAACHDYELPVAYPEPNKVEKELREWFLDRNSDKVRVIQMNAATTDKTEYTDPNSGHGGDVLWIVCGGNAISRGLTLDGLTVSYYDRIRRTTAVDAITQMGRWFGYRLGYELLPRVWMTDETISEMKNICRIETQLHAELCDLFAKKDHASIRGGREVANIRYFGRRLSGRDANGMQVGGLASKGVLEYVAKDPKEAFATTRSLILDDLRLDSVWKKPTSGFDRPLHTRHQYIWKKVDKNVVANYLNRMIACCFGESSKYNAQGLVREIANSEVLWTVVIGSPEAVVKKGSLVQLSGLEGVSVCERNQQIEPCAGGIVRTGHGTQTVQAYLACLPDEIIAEAENEIRSHYAPDSNLDGQLETVNAAYKVASRRGRQDLLNPVLLIDFVNGKNDGVYVQVSFYWFGHSRESYFKASINPFAPALVPAAVEIVEKQGYIAFGTLCKKMEERFGELDKRNFGEDVERACREANASIGVLEREEAERACLSPRVVYSIDWVRRNMFPGVRQTAESIGLDLYRKIVDGGLNQYGGRRQGGNLLDYRALSENGYDFVMAHDWDRYQPQGYGNYQRRVSYRWPDFRVKYLELDAEVSRAELQKVRQETAKEGHRDTHQEQSDEAMLQEAIALLRRADDMAPNDPNRDEIVMSAKESLQKLALHGNQKARKILSNLNAYS